MAVSVAILAASSGAQAWKAQKDSYYKYSVLMPQPVTTQHQNEGAGDLQVKSRLLLHRGSDLILVFASCRPSRAMNKAESTMFVDALKSSFLQSSGAKQTGNGNGMMNKLKGEYLDFVGKDGRKGRMWLVMTAGNLYSLTAVWKDDSTYRAGAIRFYNSFAPSGR